MEPTVLAVDCGTQSLRAMLFTADGRLLDRVRMDYPPGADPGGNRFEQDARTYWAALCDATRALRARSAPAFAGLQGVGVAALRNTPVLVDPQGEPLAPAILWLDSRRASPVWRPHPLARPLLRAAGLLGLYRQVQEDCKTNWLREHLPEAWDRAAKVLQVSGYLNHRLTGRFRDSVACQAGHLPFHYRHLRWCRPGEGNARIFPVDPDKLPDLVPPGHPLGRVTRAAAAATGLPEGLPVIAGASDKGAECLGAGGAEPASASLSLGTAAAVLAIRERYFEPVRAFPPFPGPVPGRYCPEVLVFRGYWMITWFLREFGAPERERARVQGLAPEALLDRFLEEIPPGAQGLAALPRWGPGLRDRPGQGACIGFGARHTRGHLYRALIEGLGFALRDGLERLERADGARSARIGIGGGAAQSEAICQITADVTGRELVAGETWEAAGLGTAILVAAGAGLHGSVPEAARRMVRPGRVYAPRPGPAALYDRLFRRVHRRLGPRLAPLHRELGRILAGPCGGGDHDA